MVVLFLSWNVITYYFLTYNTPPPPKPPPGKDEFITNAKSRLDRLVIEVKRQIAANEALLRDILINGPPGTNTSGERERERERWKGRDGQRAAETQRYIAIHCIQRVRDKQLAVRSATQLYSVQIVRDR